MSPGASRSRGRAQQGPVRAAGTLLWRPGPSGDPEVALVHRPRYDDWSWPKGKLDPGEASAVAAARETVEETGLVPRLGPALPPARYPVRGQDKTVDYWSATLIEDTRRGPQSKHEIDDVRWVTLERARRLLTYARDVEQLDGLLAMRDAGLLGTWPLLLVRHAHAVARGRWSRPDPLRPLDTEGRQRAAHLAPLLQAYAPTRAICSPSLRCRDTLTPWARRSGVEVRERVGLSEEGFETRPDKAVHHLTRLLERAEPAVLCSHGPLLPALLDTLRERAESGAASDVLRTASADNLDKGEVLVAHVHGRGEDAAVVAVERHRP